MNISSRVRSLIRQSLQEDIGKQDITTQLLIPKGLKGEAFIDAKAKGILCGGAVVKEVFRLVDPKLKVVQKQPDGSAVSKGKKIFFVSGKITSILAGERVALNFLSHFSGIATLTNRYVKKIQGTGAEIYDTRKTTPLWRELEKYAVKTGGGKNHRFGLWDEVLVKDNHWAVLRKMHLQQSRQGLNPAYRMARLRRKRIPVEIEAASLKELSCLLQGSFIPDRILLDNFSVPQLKKAVQMVRRFHLNAGAIRKLPLLEASGGITLQNVRDVAKTSVDRISVGALTHSAPALDFSLTISQVIKKS